MVLTVVLTGLAVILTILGVSVAFLLQYQKAKYEINQSITAFISSPDDKTPSPLAQLFDSMALILAQRIVGVAKTTFMGIQSGANRGEKAIEGALAEDMLSQTSPVIGAILSRFPALNKLVRKNPALAPMVQAVIEKVTKGGFGGNGHSGSQVSAGFQERF